ncbi:spermidine synthase [Nocardioides aequoreus]|uniref:spermidine synthase n=1 Tax=Nocardioides aequoreus TaxID=397278 RepID=UPI001FE07E99|nr:fused MFS/spermidine synthase [Nocardioides aequoreus]
MTTTRPDPATDTPDAGATTASRPPRFLLGTIVFVVGVASLGAEIAAARLLAPWFGDSTIVWANTIAITLVALSGGYALGGRLASRNPTLPKMAIWVLVASVLFAAVPFMAAPFLRQSVRAFSELSGGLFLGSLVGVGAMIAIPVLMIGIVSPYAVRLQVTSVGETGRVSGRLSALGTIGSLVGTFLATLVLIPLVGSHRTFLTFAVLLALVVVPAFTGVMRLVAIAVTVAIAVLIVLPPGSTKTVTDAGRVIHEEETEYQYARVIESDTGTRVLELNEGQAIHSIYRPDDYLFGGYWDSMLVAGFGASTPPQQVVNLGSAGGTVARGLTHYFPEIEVDAVELDDEVTELGREYFDLTSEQITTHAADARPWLQQTDKTFDNIMLDAYRQPYIPWYLTTENFFEVTKARLNPGGTVTVNVGHPPGNDDLEKVLTATMREVYGDANVWRDPVDDTNTVLLATLDDVDPRANLRSADVPPDIRQIADAAADRLEPGLDGGRVYTDDHAPVEWLIDASFAQLAE